MRFVRSFFSALESGRTMIEMLAVIVIVGVLTVGGIMGNSIANRLFRENQIHTEVETLVQGIIDTYSWARDYSALNEKAVCDNEMVANICTDDNKLRNVFGAAITVHPADNGQTFLVKYQNVPSDIADKLAEKPWQTAHYVSATCDGGNDTCTVVFGPEDGSDYGTAQNPNAPTEDVPCAVNADCDTNACEVCHDGVCIYGCNDDNGEVCIAGNCRAPICTSHADCSGNSTAKWCAVVDNPAQNTCVECLKTSHCDENACLHCVNGSCVYKCDPGQVCSNGSCSMSACQSDSECLLRNPKLPYCYETVSGDPFYNKCVACLENTHCDTTNCYKCENNGCVYTCTSDEVCRDGACAAPACQSDGDCKTKDATKPYCKQFAYADNNVCVACYQDEHCDYKNCYGCVDDEQCAYKCTDGQWCDNGTCRDATDTATYWYETTEPETTAPYVTYLEKTVTVYEVSAPETTTCSGFYSADGECRPCTYPDDVTIAPSEKAACRACGRRVDGNVCLNETVVTCTNNDDCTASYYCNITSDGTGTCEPADATDVTIGGTTYLIKYTAMTYESMTYFCERVGGTAVTLDVFNCGHTFADKMTARGYCNNTDDTGTNGTRSTNMLVFMSSSLHAGEYWTATIYGGSGSYAYIFRPDTGYIATDSKTDANYPLCYK